LDKIYDAVVNCDKEAVTDFVKRAISENADPLAIFDSLNAAVKSVGNKFGKGACFITDLVATAEAMKAGAEIIEPLILKQKKSIRTLGNVAMATAEGDIHDIGKNIVVVMLTAAGFNVLDLGVDVPTERIIETIEKSKPQVAGVSALLTSTVTAQEKLIGELGRRMMRGNVKVIVGGAPVTKEWSNQIGADGYAADGPAAVNLVKQLLGVE